MKLKDMLSPEQLGAHILVLANSIQDEGLRSELHGALITNEKQLNDNIHNGVLLSAPDDLDVFRQLAETGTSRVPSWKKNQVGVWEVMSNPFRALRPSRASREKITAIWQRFDAEKFNFNKAFLEPEILWQGGWKSPGRRCFDLKVLYNKFPIIPYHLIIVPDPDRQFSQFLTGDYHDMIWCLVAETGQNLPGFGAGYNSLGACASVNHLHFHGFIQDGLLPVELDQWTHNGGDTEYPMRCITCADKGRAWEIIREMNQKNESYNILYRPQRCYVIPRKRQGDDTICEEVSGAGWTEQCGIFVAGSRELMERFTEKGINENLKSLSM